MAAGQQPTLDLVNNQLTSCAVRLRALMSEITDLHLQVVKLDVAGLEALGAAAADAADIKGKWDLIGTVAAVYFGQASTPAYNFDDALAPVRGGLTS